MKLCLLGTILVTINSEHPCLRELVVTPYYVSYILGSSDPFTKIGNSLWQKGGISGFI